MHGNNQNRQNREINDCPAETVVDEIISPIVEEPSVAVETIEANKESDTSAEQVDEQRFGIVTDCIALNVRKLPVPNAEIVTMLPSQSIVMVDLKQSTDTFYKICNAAGIEGFCIKQYIKLNA